MSSNQFWVYPTPTPGYVDSIRDDSVPGKMVCEILDIQNGPCTDETIERIATLMGKLRAYEGEFPPVMNEIYEDYIQSKTTLSDYVYDDSSLPEFVDNHTAHRVREVMAIIKAIAVEVAKESPPIGDEKVEVTHTYEALMRHIHTAIEHEFEK